MRGIDEGGLKLPSLSRLLKMVAALGKQYIVWQEIFDNKLTVSWKQSFISGHCHTVIYLSRVM